jgi:RNA polymerase sigma-70 factor (ECF subfamily)
LRRAQSQPRLHSAAGEGDGDDDGPRDEGTADDAPGPFDLLARAGDARQLAQCIDTLSAPQRQSVALAFYDGLSHAEVAERLRQPLGTVKSWVRRALMALKDCLQRGVADDAARDREAGA